MKFSSIKKVFKNQSIQNILIFTFAILIYFIILINRSPGTLRSVSILARAGFTLVLPVITVGIYFSFRISGWIGKFLSLSITLAIFSMALAGLWASGRTEAGLLSGVIPMYDSSTYYTDSVRLLIGREFSITSSRRPLFSAFFAILLAVSNYNLMIALGLLTLIVALSCYFAAEEIRQTYGAAAATLVLTILFMFYRYHSGAPRTEALGVALGALGTAMIWRGIREAHQQKTWFGLFLISMALMARAGAFFILPLIVLWGSWVFRPDSRKFSWSFLSVSVGVVIAAFAVNQLAIRSFGSRDTVPFGNFSYSLYGLASGGNSWAYVFEANSEVEQEGIDETDIYRLAVNLILEDPALIIKGALYNWSVFFSNTGYGVYSFMAGDNLIVNQIVYWLLLIFCLLGFIRWFYNIGDPFTSFVAISAIGILISVPFLPPTDAYRVRVYAAHIVIFGLLPAVGLHSVLEAFKRFDFFERLHLAESSHDSSWGKTVEWFSVLLIASIIIGPYVIYDRENRLQIGKSNCDSSLSSAVMRYDSGTSINLLSQDTIFLDWAPQFHVGTFRRNVHDFPDMGFINWSETVKPGHSLFYGLDYRSNLKTLVVIPTELLPSPPLIMEICGSWETDADVSRFNIFYAESVVNIYK